MERDTLVTRNDIAVMTWSWDPPRRRNLISVNGWNAPVRWNAPGLVFAESTILQQGHHLRGRRTLQVFAADKPVRSPTDEVRELSCSAAICGWNFGPRNPYGEIPFGISCLSPMSDAIIRGLSPVDAFWFSPFPCLPSLCRREATVDVVTAQSIHPHEHFVF